MGFIDEKSGKKPPQRDQPPQGGKAPQRDGVRRDAQGNTFWQWAVDTGKHAIDSTSRLLKRLEVPGLRLEDDPDPQPKDPAARNGPAGAGAGRGGAGGGSASARSARGAAGQERASGYDPYGGRPPARPAAAVRKPAAAPPARPSFWRRLFRRG